MTSRAPDTSVKVTIPERGRMRGAFVSERNIQITFGKGAYGLKLQFERFALEQLAELALELLATLDVESPPDLPVRISKPGPASSPDLTKGERSTFIVMLRSLKDQIEPYVEHLLYADNSEAKQYEFGDELLLSATTSALGHSMREHAYSRRSKSADARPARADETEGER